VRAPHWHQRECGGNACMACFQLADCYRLLGRPDAVLAARLIDLFLDEFPGLGKLIATQRNFRKLPWKARASRLDGVW
jgi:hypothetical protein